jgi:uncharacterized DUF497 family protein
LGLVFDPRRWGDGARLTPELMDARLASCAESLTYKTASCLEERFVTIGMDALGRILVVVFTWRGQHIRIISARKTESHERKQYEG